MLVLLVTVEIEASLAVPRFTPRSSNRTGCRVGRQRGALAGPFPSVPLRTDRDRFRVNQLSSRATSPRFRSWCISHPLAFQMSPSLSPFAMWPALPTADSYGDSVTLGLAPVRPSRVPWVLNGSSATSASHSSPSMDSLPIAPPVGGGRPQTRTVCPQGTLRLRCGSSECAVAPLEIGIQAMQPSPYRAGLAGRHLQHLPVAPAFLACCFPLRLSPSGKPDGPETSLRVSPDCVRDSAPRSAAHVE
jgi:hypothetical protein